MHGNNGTCRISKNDTCTVVTGTGTRYEVSDFFLVPRDDPSEPDYGGPGNLVIGYASNGITAKLQIPIGIAFGVGGPDNNPEYIFTPITHTQHQDRNLGLIEVYMKNRCGENHKMPTEIIF